MSKDLKPIETVYHGYRFRSRLEARWAVFFDALGVPYEYEREGFELRTGLRYLPDFYLPHGIFFSPGQKRPALPAWVEIKPDHQDMGGHEKAMCLAMATEQPVFVIGGEPFVRDDVMSYRPVCWTPKGPNTDPWAWHQCRVCGSLQLFWLLDQNGWYCPLCYAHPPSAARLREAGVSLDDGCYIDHTGVGPLHTPLLDNAYARARQARFEYGHSGD